MVELLRGDFVTWTHSGEVRRRCVLVFFGDDFGDDDGDEVILKVGDGLYAKASVDDLTLEERGSAENAREWLEMIGKFAVRDGVAETAEEFADDIILEEDELRRVRFRPN